MAREDAKEMVDLIASLKSRFTILLIEHDMDAVFGLANRISALVYGRCIATGTPDAISRDAEVRRVIPAMGSDMLVVKGAHLQDGISLVLFGVDLHIDEGEFVALVGRNGMGKSSTIHSISVSCRPMPGR